MQPYYLAWYGFFEQIKLADIYVFYDDVQYVRRSLMSRVSIQTKHGPRWMTIPLKNVHQGDLICNVHCCDESDWRKDHLNQLRINYVKAPFYQEMYELASDILYNSGDRLSDVTISGIKKICQYFNITKSKSFYLSSELKIPGFSTERLVNISKELGANIYLTGMGALNYLDYGLFDKNGISVEFINYAKTEYPQFTTVFNPYVSILDLIALAGENGIQYFNSFPVYYKDFINSDAARDYLKTKT